MIGIANLTYTITQGELTTYIVLMFASALVALVCSLAATRFDDDKRKLNTKVKELEAQLKAKTAVSALVTTERFKERKELSTALDQCMQELHVVRAEYAKFQLDVWASARHIANEVTKLSSAELGIAQLDDTQSTK